MASSTEICNSALIKLGVEPITSLSEDSKPASLCNRQYARLRDKRLVSHYWNFAMKRVEIAASTSSPEFGFDYKYQLPSDCLRVLHLNGKNYRFKVEQGRYLHTNLASAKILYITQETDVSKYSPTFSELLAYDIAIDLCWALTGKRTHRKDLIDERAVLLADARSIDAQEGFMDSLIADEWIEARQGDPTGDYFYDESID